MLSLFCERIFNSSCSRVPIVFCIFFFFFLKDTVETRMQKCPRCVKFLTWVRHLNEVFVLSRYLVVDVCEL